MPDVICPHCGQSKAVTAETLASIAGKTIRCECKASFVVEDRGTLDFLDAPSAPVMPPKIAPTLTKEQREVVAEQNVADYKARRPTSRIDTGHLDSIVEAISKFIVRMIVVCLTIAAALYSGNAANGGIGVLVFIASLIAILLTQVIELLFRIVALLEQD